MLMVGTWALLVLLACRLPPGLLGDLGLGALAGIGFTVALFVTELAYDSVPSIGVDTAKIAILAASLVAGLWARPCCSGREPPRRASPARRTRADRGQGSHPAIAKRDGAGAYKAAHTTQPKAK